MVRVKHPWYRYHRDWKTGGKERFIRDWDLKFRDNRIVHATHRKTGVKQYTPFGKARKRSKHNRRMAAKTYYIDPVVAAIVAADMNKNPDWYLGKVKYDQRGHKYAIDDEGFAINPRRTKKNKRDLYKRANLLPQKITIKQFNSGQHPHNKFITWGNTQDGRKVFFNKRSPAQMQILSRRMPPPNLGGLGMKGRSAWKLGYERMKREYKK